MTRKILSFTRFAGTLQAAEFFPFFSIMKQIPSSTDTPPGPEKKSFNIKTYPKIC